MKSFAEAANDFHIVVEQIDRLMKSYNNAFMTELKQLINRFSEIECANIDLPFIAHAKLSWDDDPCAKSIWQADQNVAKLFFRNTASALSAAFRC